MRVAYLHCGSERYRGEPKKFWFFQGWPADEYSLKFFNRPFHAKFILGRISATLWEVFTLLPHIKNFDVVVSEGALNSFALSLFKKIFRIKKPLQIVWFVEPWRIWRPGQKIKLAMIKFLFSSIDCFISRSRAERNFWSDVLGRPEICNNVGFGYEPFEVAGIITGDYILSAGRAARDYLTLVGAAKDINAKFIVRAGKDEISGKNGLEDIALPENIQLFKEMPYNKYLDLLAKSKFIVIPLASELNTAGMNAIMEAMCIGKAVIATRTAGTVDMIINGETGLLAETGNSDDLKKKILFLLEHPEEIKRIGNNAKKAFMGNFIWEDVQKRCLTIIKKFYSESISNKK